MRHRYSILFFPLHVIVDFLGLNSAFLGAYWLKFQVLGSAFDTPYSSLWALFNIIWLVEVLILKPYIYPRQLFKSGHLIRQLLLLTGIHVAIIAVCWIAIQGYYYSREHLLFTYLLFIAFGSAFRVGGVVFLKEYRARGYNNRRYIIVGYGKLANTIRAFYDAHPEMGFNFCGYFDEANTDNAGLLDGNYTNLLPFIQANKIDCVYCCMPYMDSHQIKMVVDKGVEFDYQTKLLVDFRGFFAKGASVEYHDFLPVLNLSTQAIDNLRVSFLKRSFDILFSVLAMGLGAPFFILLAVITRVTSKGPTFYAQERIGQGGRPFKIYKFRSMYVDAEKAGPELSGGLLDARITPWGRFMRKTRLDEIPQFYNVLIGDMSVVGPRPERQFFIDKIVEVAPEYRSLLEVKPGITSIGQIKFGYAATIDEMVQRLRYDLMYPKRRSFLFDMWIIAQTLRVMAQGRGK